MKDQKPSLRDILVLWKSSLPRELLRASLAVLLIVIYLVSTVYNTRQERSLIQTDIEKVTKATTKSAQIHTQSIFDTTIQILQALRSDIIDVRNVELAQDILDRHFFDSPYLRTTLLLNQDGINVASNFRELLGTEGQGYQFFETHKNSPQDLPFTGDFIVGKVSQSPHFVSSIALNDPGGGFAGVLAGAYELSYFQRLYSQFSPNSEYTVALYHEVEGLIVTGTSEIRSGMLPVSIGFPLHLPNYQSEFQSVAIPADTAHRVLAFSLPVSGTQFYVVTFANADRLLGFSIQSANIRYLLAGLFVIIVLGLMFVVEWHSATRLLSERENMKLENELRQSQKMEALGTLAGGFAHDFNNLLSSIIGFTEMALERVHASQRPDDAMKQVLLAGRRAESMIERMLAFSERTDSQYIPFQLSAIVREALDLARISLAQSVRMHVDINCSNDWIYGDPSQIHQVVTNLVVNAAHAMPEGGDLTISLKRQVVSVSDTESSTLNKHRHQLEILVKDSGTGISDDVQSRMFDPFYTTKKHGKGTGLGLSIVRNIVEEHGGGIRVDSALGSGSEFKISFPAIENIDPTIQDQSSIDEIHGNGQVAVFVDDEQAIVTLGEERLAVMGFEPHGFTSSVEALEHIQQNPSRISLLITDISMPEIPGTELAERARALRPDLPIILITGFSTKEIIQLANRLGTCEVIKKPLRVRRLADAIVRCKLSKSRGT